MYQHAVWCSTEFPEDELQLVELDNHTSLDLSFRSGRLVENPGLDIILSMKTLQGRFTKSHKLQAH
jgi:hypothetical protein